VQASISLFVLVLSYIFQQRNRPFVTVKGLSDDLNLTAATLEAKLAERKHQAAAAIKGHSGSQSSVLRMASRRSPSRKAQSQRLAEAVPRASPAVETPVAGAGAGAPANGGPLVKVMRIMVFMVSPCWCGEPVLVWKTISVCCAVLSCPVMCRSVP
jgi:hypothetical protein